MKKSGGLGGLSGLKPKKWTKPDQRPDGILMNIEKERERYLRFGERRAKPKACILCGQEFNGPACNSHSVPRMILDNIADSGWVLKNDALIHPSKRANRGDGINRAGRFFLICNRCDNNIFKQYEDPANLLKPPSKELMAEIALKNSLLQLYKSRVEYETLKLILEEREKNTSKQDIACTHIINRLAVVELDLKNFANETSFYQRIVKAKDDDDSFRVLYYKLLPYKTSIAMQGHIPLSLDMEGRVVNNNFNYFVRTQSMHMAVFPLKKETFVLAFYCTRDKKYRPLLKQMRGSSDDVILAFLNYVILEYTENCFFSKDIAKIAYENSEIRRIAAENNMLPDFGYMVSSWKELKKARREYQPVKIHEIPNLLSEQYAVTC